MKKKLIFGIAFTYGLIASSCAVKNTFLSQPVSSVPSDISSDISAVSSEPAVSSMIAVSSTTDSAAEKTASVAVFSKAAGGTVKRAAGVTGKKTASKTASGSAPSRTALSFRSMPVESNRPYYVVYNHRIYLTPGPFFSNQNPAQTGAFIASYQGTTVCYKGLKIFAVQNVDPSKAIAVQDQDSKTGYTVYRCFSDEIAVIAGRNYRFTDYGFTSKMEKFVVFDSSESESAIASSQSNGNSSADEYQLNLNILSPIIPTIMNNVLGPKIGTIPGGTVYAIDEIDPSEAIIIHSGSLWLTATKQYGYTGKTIDQVKQEKGNGSSAVIWH